MEYTPNYNLKKPGGDDLFNVQDANDNADAIDAALHDLQEQVDESLGDLETLLAAL